MAQRRGAWNGGDGRPRSRDHNPWKPSPPRPQLQQHPHGHGWGWGDQPSPSVPLWEKRFYSEACGMTWEWLCGIQRFMTGGMHESILQWDDSAAVEALQSAKARYWAAYHGRPWDIPLPDPDMYVDEVDHDAVIDPELIADLEKEPPQNGDLDGGASNGRIIFPDVPAAVDTNWDIYLEQPIQPTGWGDAAEADSSNQHGENRVGNTWNCSGWGWDEGAAKNDQWRSGGRDNYVGNNSRTTWENRNRNFEPGRRNGMKRDGGSRWGPRHTRPKYQTNAYQLNDDRCRNFR